MHENEYLFNFICLSYVYIHVYEAAANKPLLNWHSCTKLRFILCIFPLFSFLCLYFYYLTFDVKCKQTQLFTPKLFIITPFFLYSDCAIHSLLLHLIFSLNASFYFRPLTLNCSRGIYAQKL